METLLIDDYIQLVDILSDWLAHEYEYSKDDKPNVQILLDKIERIIDQLNKEKIKHKKQDLIETELNELRNDDETWSSVWKNTKDVVSTSIVMRKRTYNIINNWMRSEECPYIDLNMFYLNAMLNEIIRIRRDGLILGGEKH